MSLDFFSLTDEELLEIAQKSSNYAVIKMAIDWLSHPLRNFTPRPDNLALYDAQTSFVNDRQLGIAVALGGNRGGKSVCGAYKAARFMIETPPPFPNCPFWVVGKSFELACNVCWRTHLSKFITPDLIQDIEWFNKATGSARNVILKPHSNGNNWIIEFKSSDQNRERFQGQAVGGVWIDEWCPFDILIEIWMRLSDTNFPGSFFYTLTPLVPDFELERRFNNNAEFSDWHFYRMNSRQNANVSQSVIDSVLDNEIEQLRLTREIGSFASFHGAVYQSFNPAVHVIKPIDIPRGWHHVRGIDFGTNHPTACVWAARDNDEHWYVYHEYFQDQTDAQSHVQAIQAVAWEETQPDYGVTYADPAGLSYRMEYAKHGLHTQPASNDVDKGIACIQRLLRNGKDGKPKIFIFDNCKKLIEEIRSYQWHPRIDRKPLKQNDDVADALRYALVSEERYKTAPEIIRKPVNGHANAFSLGR